MSVFSRTTRVRAPWLCVAFLLIAGIVGCTVKSGGYNTTSPPRIRFFNAAYDIGAVDIDIATIQTLRTLGYENSASYVNAPSGTQTVSIMQAGTTPVILQTPVDFANGQRYTQVLYGRPNAPRALTVVDNIELPGSGQYKLRFLNAATEMGPLDLYVTAFGDSLDTATPTLANVALGGASDFVLLNSSSVELRIVAAGTKTVVYDSGQITPSERNAYSFVAYSRGDPALVNGELLTLDTLGSGAAVNSTLAKFRVLDAVVGAPTINLALDGNAVVAGAAYGITTPYGTTGGGAHTITVQYPSAPGTNVLTGSSSFPPGGDSTFVVLGTAAAPIGIALQDANFLPTTPGAARLRVVNASNALGSVKTFVNGTLTVATLVSTTASLYFELPAASYTVTFVDATSSATTLDIPGLALAAGHTYTLFLIGAPGQAAYVLTQDR